MKEQDNRTNKSPIIEQIRKKLKECNTGLTTDDIQYEKWLRFLKELERPYDAKKHEAMYP